VGTDATTLKVKHEFAAKEASQSKDKTAKKAA
jgi:hypothetical protein